MTDKNKILITGATGLLGHVLVDELRPDYKVHAVARHMPAIVKHDVTYELIDLSTHWSVEDLPASVDTIVHLAQSNHFREFPSNVMNVFRVNVDSTARLLDYAYKIGAKRFIYASSGGVYGNGPAAFHENSAITQHHNLGYYLGSKLCSEVLVESYAALMDITILRPFFMYGSRQRRSMLIPRLIDSVKDGKPISLQGREGICINPVHVRDAVAVVKECLSCSGSQTLNIAGPDILSIKEISNIIGEHAGKQPSFRYIAGKPSDVVGNNELMNALLNRPLLSFRKGVLDMFNTIASE